jgi:O-acetylserine/cysteine efflux transporter
MDYFAPITIIALRLLMLVPIAFILPKAKFSRNEWIGLLLFGIFSNTFFMTGVVVALKMGLTSSYAVICQQLQIPFSYILAVLFFGEKFTFKNIIAIIICFTGLFAILGDLSKLGSMLAMMLVIAAAFVYSICNCVIKKFDNLKSFEVIIWSGVLSAPIQLLLAYLFEDLSVKHVLNAPLSAILSVAFLAYGVTTVAYMIWLKMMAKYPIHKVAPFSLFGPLSGVISSVIILKEKLTSELIVGGVLITLGVIVINLKRKKNVRIKS